VNWMPSQPDTEAGVNGAAEWYWKLPKSLVCWNSDGTSRLYISSAVLSVSDVVDAIDTST